MTLAGRTAVVTGAGRGIGAAVAEALANAGAAVVVSARTRPEIERVARALTARGHTAHAVTCDVTDPTAVRALAECAAECSGPADILVNNAGTAWAAPFARQTLQDWERLLAVNATGPFLCTQAFLPAMLERGWGRIVVLASVAALKGARYVSAYTASKHAVLGLTRALAAEIAGTGVTVNAVCPGYVDTSMTDESIRRIVERTGRSPAEALDAVLRTAGQARLIRPDEVARAVAALCADDAGEINGQAVVLDGGERVA